VAWPIQSTPLRTERPRKLRWVASFAIAGGVVAGVIAYSVPARYTSVAILGMTEATIPERFVPSAGQPDMRRHVDKQAQIALSRRALREIIRVYGLYKADLARKPVEDVIEEMRRDISISAGANNMVQIAYTYSTPREAQKVARDLMTRIIDTSIRERSQEKKALTMFLESRAEATAKEWMSAIEARKGLEQGKPEWEKASLDVELARQEYQAARAKLSQARTGEVAASWKYDATLEVLDLPSLPQTERYNRPLIVGVGVLAGLMLGLLTAWLRTVRPVDAMISAPTSA
jgi:uncharacterized protein involved in exopolysaccharide biosynthesis